MPYDHETMLSLLPIALCVTMPVADEGFRVIDVQRHEVFAGRLGRRVTQIVTAEKDGKRYEIVLGRSHTAIRGSVRELSNGDTFRPDWGAVIREK